MGLEAWECACRALGVEGDWRTHRDSGEPLGQLVAVFHPAARVAWERLAAPWEVLGHAAVEERSTLARVATGLSRRASIAIQDRGNRSPGFPTRGAEPSPPPSGSRR